MLDFALDPDLPRFSRALDATTMRHAFDEHLASIDITDWRIRDCRLERFRYRHGSRAIMLYELSVENDQTGRTVRQWATGTLYAGTKGRTTTRKLAERDTIGPFPRPTGITLPGHSFMVPFEMLVEWYPSDRHMPEVAAVFRGQHDELTRLLADAGDDTDGPARVIIEPMRYRPGVTSTIKFTRDSDEIRPAGDAGTSRTTFVKMYRDYDRDSRLAVWTALAEGSRDCRGRFEIPPLLGTLDTLKAVAVGPARGKTVEDLLRDGIDPAGLATLCASAINALQASKITLPRTREADGQMRRLKRAAKLIAWASPDVKPRIDRIVHQIAATWRPTVLCPAHLDLKPDHIFIDRSGTTTFIDVDSAALADPMLDPAQLIARIDMMPLLRSDISAKSLKAFRDAMLMSTLATAPAGWSSNFGPAYAFGAMQTALFFLQHLEPDWQVSIASVLSRIERELWLETT